MGTTTAMAKAPRQTLTVEGQREDLIDHGGSEEATRDMDSDLLCLAYSAHGASVPYQRRNGV